MLKNTLKSVLYLILGFALVIVLGLAALPYFVSSELVRSAAEREVSDFTGRPVSLNGDIDVSLFPSPVARFKNVIIPGEIGDPHPFLEIESAKVDIALLTLISRNPQFIGFELERPRLNLIRNKNGLVNWRQGFSRVAAASNVARQRISKSQDSGASEPLTTDDLLTNNFPKRLGMLSISGGVIRVRNEADEIEIETSAIQAKLNWPALDRPVSANGTAIIRGVPVTLNLSIEAPLSMLAGQASAAKLNTTSDIATFSYEGSLGFYDNLFADGALSLDIKSMPATLDFLAAEISPGKAINTVRLNGPINLSNQKARFDNLAIEIDENAGTGVLEIAAGAEGNPPLLGGTFDFQTLDLSSFLSAFIDIPTGARSTEADVDLSFISELRADLRVSAATANFGAIALSNVAATAQINDTSAIFDIGDGEVYGGNIQARLQFSNDKQDAAAAQLNFSAQNIDTTIAREALSLPKILPLGTATVTINATSLVGDWASMMQQASGTTTFEMGAGTTQGFGVSRLLETKSATQFFTLSADEQLDENFEALSINGALADGIVTIEKADINYPNGSVQFEGVAPFRSGGIALTATAKPQQNDEAKQPKRFFIGGSWERAFATPLPAGSPLPQ